MPKNYCKNTERIAFNVLMLSYEKD
uniref:Uncharacterized protein n=1 Tax=Anguilla anguilla TaxID=7936 RepID=A0A0E9UBH4_ANGAN